MDTVGWNLIFFWKIIAPESARKLSNEPMKSPSKIPWKNPTNPAPQCTHKKEL
jgi:hypothetical protein